MGRKKIQISRITDERNRQVRLVHFQLLRSPKVLASFHFFFITLTNYFPTQHYDSIYISTI